MLFILENRVLQIKSELGPPHIQLVLGHVSAEDLLVVCFVTWFTLRIMGMRVHVTSGSFYFFLAYFLTLLYRNPPRGRNFMR